MGAPVYGRDGNRMVGGEETMTDTILFWIFLLGCGMALIGGFFVAFIGGKIRP